MSLSKTLNLIMMSMRTNGCFFPNMGAFSFSLSTHVNSCQLPSKFGNFWLFAPDTTANEEIENLDNLSSLDISMLLSEEDSLEVIFLDIEGNLKRTAKMSRLISRASRFLARFSSTLKICKINSEVYHFT